MDETGSEEVKLDWSSAEVHDGELEVALDRKPPKEWKEVFERTSRLLNRGTWDEVKVKKGRISLGSLKPGDEDRVRHFLESVVLEANSSIQATDPAEADADLDAERAEQNDEAEDPADQEMTERLRSFGETASDS